LQRVAQGFVQVEGLSDSGRLIAKNKLAIPKNWIVLDGEEPRLLNPEEDQILADANDLFRTLDMTYLQVTTLSWKKTKRIEVLEDELILPSRLKGKLAVDDWRSLIASSVLYDRDKGRWYVTIWKGPRTSPMIKELILPLGISEIPLVTAILLIFRTSGTTFVILWLATFASWLAFATFIVRRMFILKPRNLHLQADREAAEHVGRESLLKVLQKLQGPGLSDIQPSPRNPLRISPSIHERIENLT
jgi:hypothetical protein